MDSEVCSKNKAFPKIKKDNFFSVVSCVKVLVKGFDQLGKAAQVCFQGYH